MERKLNSSSQIFDILYLIITLHLASNSELVIVIIALQCFVKICPERYFNICRIKINKITCLQKEKYTISSHIHTAGVHDAKRPLPSVLQLSPAGQYVASQDVHRDRDEATSGDQIDGQTD